MAEINYETTREKLLQIQAELNAPKNQYNKFGGYAYRSCEDIYNALKPLLKKYGCTLTLSDEVVQVGERYYVKATATLKPADVKQSGFEITNTAFAREEETKRGMDGSQITGASSSYARKYALNGLFLIDDVRDSDVTNTHGKDEPKETKFKNIETEREQYMSFTDDFIYRHPDMKERIFTKYGLKEVRDMQKLKPIVIDEIITGMKKIDAQSKADINSQEETF